MAKASFFVLLVSFCLLATAGCALTGDGARTDTAPTQVWAIAIDGTNSSNSEKPHQNFQMDSAHYYVLDRTSVLIVMDRASGTSLWTYQVPAESNGFFVLDKAGVVIVNNGSHSNVGLNSTTGAVVWSVKHAPSRHAFKWSSKNAKVVNGHDLLVSIHHPNDYRHTLALFSGADGSLVWESVEQFSSGQNGVFTCGGNVIGVQEFEIGGVVALDIRSGTTVWNVTSVPSVPALVHCASNKYILGYTLGSTGYFTLDATSGSMVANSTTAVSDQASNAEAFGDYYCLQLRTWDTHVVCIDVKTITPLFKPVWMPVKWPEDCGTSLVEDELNGNQFIWFCHENANTTVYGFSAKTGNSLWTKNVAEYDGNGEVRQGGYIFLSTKKGFAAVNANTVKPFNGASRLKLRSIFLEKEGGKEYVYLATDTHAMKVQL